MKKELKFWGTRGSCAVSGPQFSRFGGNTSCLEVRYEESLLILDAGTGILPLGKTLKENKKIDLFLSHFHWDHIIGFPFFEPLYHQDTHITIWAPQGHKKTIQELFQQLLAEEFFPIKLAELRAKLEFRPIQENHPFQTGPIRLDFHKVHHPGLTYGFKIHTPHQIIGYVTDDEIQLERSQALIDFYRGCDLLIHEAQYLPSEYVQKKGWGHTSLPEAIRFINAVKPGKWLVTHHDPSHTDEDLLSMQKEAQKNQLCCPVEWIGDGYVLNLS
jgi:phosphoribosyl 1,2-cyclic phosphodiesterase